VLLNRPSATVTAVPMLDQAIEHLRASEAAGVQVHLVITEFDIDPIWIDDDYRPPLEQMLEGPNGFGIVGELARIDASPNPRIGFCYKPHVAMVTNMVEQLVAMANQAGWWSPAGSVNGCNSLLPKPLTRESARVLVEGTIL